MTTSHLDADRALVRLSGMLRPVAFLDCRHLIDKLPYYFRDWKVAPLPDDFSAEPVITVAPCKSGYRLTASWFGGPLDRPDDVEAICALIAEAVRARVDEDQDYACLHAAAVEIAGRLVVFPNRYRAGKSLLAGCLAARGMRIFADDVLPLKGAEATAVAPGVLPRLRLPLPDGLDTSSRAFFDCRMGDNNDRYVYLDLPDRLLATHGEQKKISAIVLLDRRDDAPAELQPITRGEALRQIIRQNFGREAGPENILARLERAVRAASCYRLTYGRADDAADLLKNSFSDPAIRHNAKATEADVAQATVPPTPVAGAVGKGTCFRRCASLAETRLDGETYLADSRSGAIHHLDPIATAVWHLLAQPMHDGEIVAELCAAFPGVDPSRIAADVAALLNDLQSRKLIREA